MEPAFDRLGHGNGVNKQASCNDQCDNWMSLKGIIKHRGVNHVTTSELHRNG